MTVRKRLHQVSQSPWFYLALIGLLVLPALWALITQGFPKTHDASVHLIRLHLLDEQVRASNLFPRWLPDLMTGYGYPLFNFYAPLIYYGAGVSHNITTAADGAPLADQQTPLATFTVGE